jgi:hypothetical protein
LIVTRDLRWLAGLVVVLCGAVVAVAAAGRSWAAEGSGSGLSGRLLGLLVVGGLAAGWLLLGGRLARGLFDRWLRAPGAQLIAGIAAVASLLLVLLVGVAGHRAEWFSDNSCCGPAENYVASVPTGVAVSGGASGGGTSGSSLSSVVVWGLLGLTLFVLVAALVVVVLRRRRAGAWQGAEEAALAAAVAEAVTRSLDDLRATSDLRRAVIACYARMERALAVAGVRREPFEAPFEYLERVLRHVRASADAARQLTRLFEEAKFSVHPVGEPMRERAVAALVRLREEVHVR